PRFALSRRPRKHFGWRTIHLTDWVPVYGRRTLSVAWRSPNSSAMELLRLTAITRSRMGSLTADRESLVGLAAELTARRPSRTIRRSRRFTSPTIRAKTALAITRVI